MLERRIALAAFAALSLVACGEKTAEGDVASVPSSDSLIPISDAPPLDSSKPPAPPETVYVQQPTTTRPVATRPAPPPATRPSPTTSTPVAPAPAPAPAPVAPRLASGAAIATVTLDSVHSQYTKVGDQIRVRVSRDVTDADGDIVIPAGSVISLAVVEIAQADNRDEKGTLTLAARTITINGVSYPITARATDYEYEMKARGVGAGEVAKTGGGAAAGAIIGRVIGGKTGTIVGAVGGAAAGAAVASKTANRDIIVHAGKAMTITLRDTFEKP